MPLFPPQLKAEDIRYEFQNLFKKKSITEKKN